MKKGAYLRFLSGSVNRNWCGLINEARCERYDARAGLTGWI